MYVCTPEEGEDPSVSSYSSMVGEQFTEIFTKRQENIELLLNLLDEFDFKVRYPAVKLLTNLLKNRCVFQCACYYFVVIFLLLSGKVQFNDIFLVCDIVSSLIIPIPSFQAQGPTGSHLGHSQRCLQADGPPLRQSGGDQE